MAITLISAPSGTPSVHDNMWHIVSSDNSGATDFKFVFDIYVNGDQKIRVKQFPNPTTGKGYFDAGPTVRNEMDYAWFEPTNSSVFVSQLDMSGQAGVAYEIQFGEDFSGTTTTNMASGQVSGYNWAPPLFKRRVVNMEDKLNQWLTNRPYVMSVGEEENLFEPFYTEYLDEDVEFYVRTYNHSNTLITSASGATVAAPLLSGVLQYNIGPPAIFNSIGVTIDDSVKYYEVALRQTTPGEHPGIRVNLDCNQKYNCTPIHFLNRWGAWETLRFDLASRLSMNIERKGFGRRDHEFTDTTVDYYSDANRYYEGKINYSNKANWAIKLNANAMSDADYEWVAELFTSPQILLEHEEYFYPVTIKKNNYDYLKFVNDRLKSLEVEFEFNTERMTQLR